MSSNTSRKLAAMVAVLTLVATACGDENADSPAPITGDITAVTAQAAATEAADAESAAPESAAPESAAPQPAGLDLEALTDELQTLVDEWREASGAPGVSLSVRLPEADSIEVVSGVTDLVTEEPVETDDYFRIASITKPMTSVMILQLVDEGLVDLDEPVTTYLGDWLGEYPYEDDITVRQLLDHTNGLIEFAFDPGFYIEAAARPTTAYEPEEILEYLSRQEPLAGAGEEYSYETGGFVAAGLIVEAVTGNSAVSEMNKRVFDPANADHIFLTPDEFPPESVVGGYVRDALYSALISLPGIEDEQQLVDNGEPVLNVLEGPQEVLQSAGWTGGGNEAQMSDVTAIFKAMFDGTLLPSAMIDEMTRKTLDTNYGLGIDVDSVDGETVYRHGGGAPGFSSQAGYLPEHNIAYAVSSTLIPLPDDAGIELLGDQILKLAVGATSSS